MSRLVSLMLGSILSLALILPALARHSPGIAQEAPAILESLQRPAASPPKHEFVGTASCFTSLCHGGNTLGQPGSEATTWRAADPHARACDTLLTSQSQAIAKNLWGTQKTAYEATLCLKCHVHPNHDPSRGRPNLRIEDGVSCESCHGAAKDWLTPHSRSGWKNADKLSLGFADTKSLVGRASICAGCHVGKPGAEVDHDLIAAGHPVLRFEFATYFANLPTHWNVQKDKEANSTNAKKSIDFEARAWTIGQMVTAASALELLAHRADPMSGKPWPEFAELDCFACHHALRDKSWRQHEKHLSQRSPGAFSWNTWHYALLPDVLEVSQATKAIAAAESFASVRDCPEHNLFSLESRRDLAKQAINLSISLRDAAHSKLPAPDDSWLDRLGPKRPTDRNWEEATQHYLALSALRALTKDNSQPRHAALERLIAELRRDVTFREFNSPGEFVPLGLRVSSEK